MRISDWSSDVCSSVLAPLFADMPVHVVVAGPDDARHRTLLDGAADTLAGHQFSKTLRQGKPEAVIADVVAATPGAILVMGAYGHRSEEHTSELPSLMRISYAVFCLKKKTKI